MNIDNASALRICLAGSLCLAVICGGVFVFAQVPAQPPAAAAPAGAQRPKRPGVATPGVRIPIERLKPEAVYEFAGAPDWMAA